MSDFEAREMDDAFIAEINDFLDRVEAEGQKAILLTFGENEDGDEFSGYFGSRSTDKDERERVLIQTVMGLDDELAGAIRQFLARKGFYG